MPAGSCNAKSTAWRPSPNRTVAECRESRTGERPATACIAGATVCAVIAAAPHPPATADAPRSAPSSQAMRGTMVVTACVRGTPQGASQAQSRQATRPGPTHMVEPKTNVVHCDLDSASAIRRDHPRTTLVRADRTRRERLYEPEERLRRG